LRIGRASNKVSQLLEPDYLVDQCCNAGKNKQGTNQQVIFSGVEHENFFAKISFAHKASGNIM
jgi:hypothetical protein